METLARALALLGGAILLGLIALTCLSILGRQAAGVLNGAVAQRVAPELAQSVLAMGMGPFLGDYELVELGMGVAIFCFLPYCHLSFGHARVDLFKPHSTGPLSRLSQAGIEALFTLALGLIAWRLAVGTLGRLDSGQTSYLLQVPLWLPYAAAVLAAVVSVASSLILLAIRIAENVGQRTILPNPSEGGA